MEEVKRGRGRPKLNLTPAEIEERRQKQIEYQRQWSKDNPDKVKKKNNDFNKRHPGKRCDNIIVSMPLGSKHIIDEICREENKNISKIVIELLEQRFGIKLKK